MKRSRRYEGAAEVIQRGVDKAAAEIVRENGISVKPKAKPVQPTFPMHLAKGAQGPIGIMDAKGKAILWCSDELVPLKGYAWEPEKRPVTDPDGHMMTTYYSQRNAMLRFVFDMLYAKYSQLQAGDLLWSIKDQEIYEFVDYLPNDDEYVARVRNPRMERIAVADMEDFVVLPKRK